MRSKSPRAGSNSFWFALLALKPAHMDAGAYISAVVGLLWMALLVALAGCDSGGV